MSADLPTDSGEPLELADLLNTVLDKGVVLHGDITLAVADVDLVQLNLGLLLSALETVQRREGRSEAAVESQSGGPSITPMQRGLAAALGPPNLRPVSSVPSDRDAGASVEVSRDASPSGAAVPTMREVAPALPERINADPDRIESGLARLVLTLIEVLRKVLEHQAVRRMDGGRLTPEEVERLGLALARLEDRMGDLKRVFGLTDEDLQIDLGPLGRVR